MEKTKQVFDPKVGQWVMVQSTVPVPEPKIEAPKLYTGLYL